MPDWAVQGLTSLVILGGIAFISWLVHLRITVARHGTVIQELAKALEKLEARK